MNYIQEAVDFMSGNNYRPIMQRLRLPATKEDTSIFLLSDSYEYDIELVKKFPQPKMEYKTIVIPYRVMENIGGRPLRFIMSQNEYTKKIAYLNEQRMMNPKLIPLKFPYPNTIKENVYIPISELFKQTTPLLRKMSIEFIRDNIFNIFHMLTHHFNYSRTKVLWIDTSRYKIYKNPTTETFHTDLINALMTAYVLNNENKIRKLDWIFIFRGDDADYRFDLRNFSKSDLLRLKDMLNKVGKGTMMMKQENEIEDSIDALTVKDEEVSGNEDMEKVDKNDPDDLDKIPDEDAIQIQSVNKSSNKNLKSSLNALAEKYGKTNPDEENSVRDKLYDAKALSINADLAHKINMNTSVINRYKRISSTPSTDAPVEQKIIDDANQKMQGEVEESNEISVLNTVSSPRELEIRKQMGQIKLNDISFDKITSVVDVPKAAPSRPLHVTTTNPAAMKGTSFATISEQYEDKLMDRDIVSTFMNLSKLPDGFYVTNVDVTDVSDVMSLTNNWKVTLRNRSTNTQSIINVRVPKVINGRFYNNGIWYNIQKQDFPIPILKINSKTVIITSNYNKITVSRYDTKSLVDLSALVKVINKQDTKNGNPYVKVGSSVRSNDKYISTIEFDEYAKRWYSFKVKETNCEVYFNRDQCLKMYQFVSVKPNEFCCGMINQVPVVLNTDTGLTRSGKSLTTVLVEALPTHLQEMYQKIKPGKMSMYTTIKIGGIVPLGVAIAAWEGMSSLLKQSGCKYQYVDKRFNDPNYITIPFKDKSLAIQNTIQNQLIFNGFFRINTKGYNVSDFESPIMKSNSVFVDIFNQHFFKQYSQLTTFITYYHFFMDAITYDVCNHYNIPNTLTGVLLYSSNLLADNNYSSEANASLYRIRCSEIIPAMIHYELAVAISQYNNRVGSRSKQNKLVFNPNKIIQDLIDTETVSPMSALNPMNELNSRELISKKGFKGVNTKEAYTQDRRMYDETMVGKMALSSPNNATVGINRQLVVDPKIESVRGYTSVEGLDADYNDLQLASFSELLTPGTVTRDDAIRTAIATSQTSHIVATEAAQPVLISNGVDEIVPSYLTDEFSVVAKDDGKVLEIADGYMIIEYKNGEKRAINVDHRQSYNTSSGFYVDNKLEPNFQQGDSFKKGEILAYHEKFFNKDSTGQIRLNIGPIAKIAFMGLYSTYEDAGSITTKMSRKLSSRLSMRQIIKLDASADIDKIVHVGDEVEIGDPLVVFGLGDTGDKSVDNFLKAFSDGVDDDSFKRSISSDHAGKITAVHMYTNKSLDKLSPSLFNLLSAHFKENRKRRRILDKYDNTSSPYKMGTLYALPTEPLKTPTIRGINTDVLIEIYIEHDDEMSVGDKCVAYGACKQITSEVIPEGLEPYGEYRPDEEISMFQAPSSILKRMVPSLVLTASGNKVLIELKRQIKQLWENNNS